jgi:DNA-binding NarL/FixJ family response regulator
MKGGTDSLRLSQFGASAGAPDTALYLKAAPIGSAVPREETRLTIRVLIADDHKILRDGLRNLIEAEADMEMVGEAENGRDAVRLAEKTSPDVVLMDINMPDLNGMEATVQLLAAVPAAKVIALSMYASQRFVAGMFVAGARGFVVKDCAFEELCSAVRAVASGRSYLSSEITDLVVEDYVSCLRLNRERSQPASILSDREREVLQLLAEGCSTKEIGERLCVSGKTVYSHIRRIMKKLGLGSIAELTKYAVREGLTSAEG